MSKPATKLGILCDTGFLIRLNQPQDELHGNARGYLKYLLAGEHQLYVSKIALAEYAVRDRIENLPMKYFRVLPCSTSTTRKKPEKSLTPFSPSGIRFLRKSRSGLLSRMIPKCSPRPM